MICEGDSVIMKSSVGIFIGTAERIVKNGVRKGLIQVRTQKGTQNRGTYNGWTGIEYFYPEQLIVLPNFSNQLRGKILVPAITPGNKQGRVKMSDKIYILGNGNQAPYGIGEIIDIVPMAHNRKIISICSEYYNAPTLRLNGKGGNIIDLQQNEQGVVELIDIGRKEY